jgi:hypothetical protein
MNFIKTGKRKSIVQDVEKELSWLYTNKRMVKLDIIAGNAS